MHFSQSQTWVGLYADAQKQGENSSAGEVFGEYR